MDTLLFRARLLYVGAEGVGGLPKRLHALVEHHGLTEPPPDLYIIDRAVDLLSPASMAEAVAEVEAFGVRPVLVVFDTYARCMIDGEENSAKDAGKAVAAIDGLRRRLDTTVMVVHHTDKSGSTGCGSGTLRGAADTMLKLDKGDSGLLWLTIDDQKNFERADAIAIRLEPVGNSLVTVDASQEVREAQREAFRSPL